MTKKELLEREYSKQRKRIQSYIRKKEKEGIYIPDSVIPKKPKTITEASISKLKQITPEKLRKKSYEIDLDTGELVKLSKNKPNIKAQKTKTKSSKDESTRDKYYKQHGRQKGSGVETNLDVNDNFLDSIYEMCERANTSNSRYKAGVIRRLIDEQIESEGLEKFLKRLKPVIGVLHEAIYDYIFDSDPKKATVNYQKIIYIIKGYDTNSDLKDLNLQATNYYQSLPTNNIENTGLTITQ